MKGKLACDLQCLEWKFMINTLPFQSIPHNVQRACETRGRCAKGFVLIHGPSENLQNIPLTAILLHTLLNNMNIQLGRQSQSVRTNLACFSLKVNIKI